MPECAGPGMPIILEFIDICVSIFIADVPGIVLPTEWVCLLCRQLGADCLLDVEYVAVH